MKKRNWTNKKAAKPKKKRAVTEPKTKKKPPAEPEHAGDKEHKTLKLVHMSLRGRPHVDYAKIHNGLKIPGIKSSASPAKGMASGRKRRRTR